MSDAGAREFLLDTHAFIWFAVGKLKAETANLLLRAATFEGLLVSPVSAWEIGLLARQNRSDGPNFDPEPRTWFGRAIRLPGVRETPLTASIGLEAALLPPPFHKDPADRLLVATARELNVAIVTRDRKILEYAQAGHVRVLRC